MTSPSRSFSFLHRGPRGHAGLAAGLALAAAASVSACDDDGAEDPPRLVRVAALTPMGEMDIFPAAPDAGTAVVPAFARIEVIFDALLDGGKIEDIDGGTARPRPDVVSITRQGGPAGPDRVTALTSYSPGGVMNFVDPAPSIFIDAVPTMPSSAQLLITLDPARLTGKGGRPYQGPTQFVIEVAPFVAAIDAGMGQPVEESFPVRVSFSNLPADDIAGAISVTDEAGMAVAAQVLPDPQNPTAFAIFPPSTDPADPTAGAWPRGRLTITVAETATDILGVPIAMPAQAILQVGEPVDAGAEADASTDAG